MRNFESKSIGFVLLLVVLILPHDSSGEAPSNIFLDLRLLVAAHPLLKSFESVSHRFKGTASEHIPGGEDGIRALISEIQQVEERLCSSLKILQQQLEGTSSQNRLISEKKFLVEKKIIEKWTAEMKKRVYNAYLIPSRPGVTPINSIYPQILQIMRDIKTVCLTLKTKYHSSIVMDISSLFPLIDDNELKYPLLLKNLHNSFWQGKFNDPQTLPWLREGKKYWASNLDGSWVIPFGAMDVRLESIRLIEQQAEGK